MTTTPKTQIETSTNKEADKEVNAALVTANEEFEKFLKNNNIQSVKSSTKDIYHITLVEKFIEGINRQIYFINKQLNAEGKNDDFVKIEKYEPKADDKNKVSSPRKWFHKNNDGSYVARIKFYNKPFNGEDDYKVPDLEKLKEYYGFIIKLAENGKYTEELEKIADARSKPKKNATTNVVDGGTETTDKKDTKK